MPHSSLAGVSDQLNLLDSDSGIEHNSRERSDNMTITPWERRDTEMTDEILFVDSKIDNVELLLCGLRSNIDCRLLAQDLPVARTKLRMPLPNTRI
jgi:hypothetical protein